MQAFLDAQHNGPSITTSRWHKQRKRRREFLDLWRILDCSSALRVRVKQTIKLQKHKHHAQRAARDQMEPSKTQQDTSVKFTAWWRDASHSVQVGCCRNSLASCINEIHKTLMLPQTSNTDQAFDQLNMLRISQKQNRMCIAEKQKNVHLIDKLKTAYLTTSQKTDRPDFLSKIKKSWL